MPALRGHSWLSTAAALVVFLACLFPLVCIWVPDPAVPTLARTAGLVPWYGATALALALLAFAAAYWVLFRVYIAVRAARGGQTLRVTRRPKFKAEVGGGGLTQILEIVTVEWVREMGELTLDEIDEGDGRVGASVVSSVEPRPMTEVERSRRQSSPLSELPVTVSSVQSVLSGGTRRRHELA